MDSKRTIIAMAASVVILVAWQFLFPAPKPPAAPAAMVAAQANAAAPAQAAATMQAAAPALAAAPAAAEAPAQAVQQKASILSNDVVSVRLSNRGARIEDVTLAKYTDVAGPSGKPLVLLPGELDSAGALALEVADPRGEALYAVTEESPGRVVYAWQSPNGLRVEKTYTLAPGRYDVNLSVKVRNAGTLLARDRLSLVMVRDLRAGSSSYVFEGPAYYKGGTLEEVKVKNLKDGVSSSGNVSWAGTVDRYFLELMVPDDPAKAEVSLSRELGEDGVARIALSSAPFDLAPGAETTYSARIVAAPKLKSLLESLDSNLDQAIEFGWFTVIAKPLLVFLHWLYGVFGNYGVAILILTACVKLLFWPLSDKSYKSMARMRDLQPKVQKLKERYANDRERLNMEMMQLWKTHKVNPFSGCLPLFVQIPVFIALYRALMGSIEIRHAPFALWLQDLSVPDPYYVTPVIMGVSMFLQQKLTPSTGAPEAQQKIMMYGMPILFTWLFKDFPSGLVIYWLMNNVLSIAQQMVTMRRSAKAKA